MSNFKEIILECQDEVIREVVGSVWINDTPADDMKCLAYISGVHDMAHHIINELCGEEDDDE